MARKISVADMSAEERAERAFRVAEIHYNDQWDVVNSMKDDDPNYPKAMKEIDKRMTVMFRQFDHWRHVVKTKFTAADAEVKQILVDALMANADALPDIEEMTGLEKHRYCVWKADELLSALKVWGVKVRPLEIETPPFCDSCYGELIA